MSPHPLFRRRQRLLRTLCLLLCITAFLSSGCDQDLVAAQGPIHKANTPPVDDSTVSQLGVSTLPKGQEWSWSGNASIITHAVRATNGECVENNTGCFGLSHDVTRFNPMGDNNPAVFFQWFRSPSHPNIKIAANYNQGPDKVIQRVNITYGSWSTRESDITYRNVELPFVIDAGHDFPGLTWFTIAVTPASSDYDWLPIVNGLQKSVRITAEATKEFPTHVLDASDSLLIDTPHLLGSKEKGTPIKVDGHTWNGNGSIISFTSNETEAKTGFGITKDWANIHASSELNPVVFFQWEIDGEDGTKLKLRDVDGVTGDMNVTITFGGWSDRENDVTIKDVKLPYMLDPDAFDKAVNDGRWYVVRVAFSGKPHKSTSIEAAVVKE